MAKTVNRQIGYRVRHSSEILGDDLIIWGGYQDGLPDDHDSEKKRLITTNLDILNLPTLKWNKVSTDGTPPAAARNYSTATIGEEMYVFGGRCDGLGDCVHNDLYQLNTNIKVWRSIPCTNKPMKKYNCGFISYFYQGSDYLLALGGKGGHQRPDEPQAHSLYTCYYGYYSTNEVHLMNIATSPGTWISPTVTGDRPPPISYFTLNQLPNDRSKAVLFGGVILPKTNKRQGSNDIYTLSLTSDTVEFTKLSPQPHSLWPKPRKFHSSTIIAIGNEDHLFVIGGMGDDNTLADCWVLNITTKRWSQIDLPQSVCGRCDHSVSSVTINTNTQWIIVTGGRGVRRSFIQDDEVTMIVELEYSSLGWLVGGVWNSTQTMELTEQMKRIRQPKKLSANGETLRSIGSMTQEIQQLKQQLHSSQQIHQQQNTELAAKQKVIQQLTNDNRLLQDDITKKVLSKQRLFCQTQQLQADITEKDKVIKQLTDDIQQLQAERNFANQQLVCQNQRLQETIQEKEAEIVDLQKQLENRPWILQAEEVQTTNEKIGGEAYGEVKVAIFRGTRVAAKHLHEIIVSSRHNTGIFTREMDISSKIHHPNIVQFIGAIIVNNPILLYELMATSLHKKLQDDESLKHPQIINICHDIASALCYLHQWRPDPIIHRDVSSPNVLMEPLANNRWRSKLSDFGSASLQLHVKTVIPGNPAYAAPEAIVPQHHSPAMDVYSFGILATEMTLHSAPEMDSSRREARSRRIEWRPMKVIVLNCIKDDRNQRLTSAQLLKELCKF